MATMTAGPTSTASSAKTTRMRALATRQPTLPQGRRAGSKVCYMGHATMENRHGLAVAGMVTLANGTAERRASQIMLKATPRRRAAASRWAKIRPMTRPTMWPICALSTLRRM